MNQPVYFLRCRALAFLATVLAFPSVLSGFAGGDGSPENPFQVASPEHLTAVRMHPAAHFIQTADIDLGFGPWNTGPGWAPIGTADVPFSGVFNGDGHAIFSLKIHRNAPMQGLFGYIENALIRDLEIRNASVTNYDERAGILFGFSLYSTIADVRAEGSVTSSGQYIGGLGGQAEGGLIDRVELDVEVTSGRYGGGLVGHAKNCQVDRIDARVSITSTAGDIGGLVGHAQDVSLQRALAWVEVVAGGPNAGGLFGHGHGWAQACGVSGSVEGTDHVGGFAGRSNFQNVLDSFSHVSVKGGNHVGGLIGRMTYRKLSRAFSTGAVVGTGEEVGGLVGSMVSLSTRFSYWDTVSSGLDTSATGEGLTTAEMGSASSFPGFNFFTLWQLEEGDLHPSLRENWAYPSAPLPVALEDLAGMGTAEDPYLLSDASGLHAMRLDRGAHYLLANDIDAAETAFWFSGQGWAPVGTSSERFTGVFDGGGHLLANLSVNRDEDAYGSLLGYVENATIRDVIMTGVHIFGNNFNGALMGYGHHVLVEKAAIAGFVCGAGPVTGGLMGSASHGLLRQISFSGGVFGQNSTGGLVGEMRGNVSEAAVEAGVVGRDRVGGLIGYVPSASEIRMAVFSGRVEGNNSVGGLIGDNLRGGLADVHSLSEVRGASMVGGLIGTHGNNARLDRGYASGLVQGGGDDVGGLIGRLSGSGVTHAYWDTEISGLERSAGGEGRTTGQMRTRATYPAFDFNRVWEMEEGEGTPLLRDLSGASGGPLEVALADLPGSGVPEDPYLIADASQLHAVRLDPAAHYLLTGDIDLADSAAWDFGGGWLPIGDGVARFTGVFDGGGHVIRGLTINRPTTVLQGLFGDVRGGAVIRHVRLEEANVQAAGQSGLLAGYVEGSQIDNVMVEGTLASTGNLAGGLIGDLRGSTAAVSRSLAHARVWGGDGVGGLAGQIFIGPDIRYSASNGEIHGKARVGGLVGHNFRGQIADVYSGAMVRGETEAGGLIGLHNSAARLDRGYAMGLVEGGGPDIGGLIGSISASAVAHGYWDTEGSGQPASAGGMGRTTAEMRQRATFPAFNFDTAWMMEEGVSAPVFQDLSVHPGTPGEVDLSSLAGAGTLEDPRIVTTPEELNAVRQDPAVHYRLGNSIDLAASLVWDYGRGWQPIGHSTDRFTGSFDGAGHSIHHLVINRPGAANQGLFGDLNQGAVIRNLRLENSHAQAHARVGLVAGIIGFGYLEGVSASGKVAASGGYVGGLVGDLGGNDSALSRVYAQVDVWGGDQTGGVVGFIGGTADVRYAMSSGTVIGLARVGGLVGQSLGRIADAHSHAAVHGANEVGGLLGLHNGRVYRSYSNGLVTGGGEHVGGLIGRRLTLGVVAHSVWDTDSSGQEESAGGEGRSSDQMRERSTYPTFNFHTAWRLEEDSPPVFRDLLAYPGRPDAVDVSSLPGAGTAGDPFRVSNAAGLRAMLQAPHAHYRLADDIDLSETLAWDYGRGWQPIGGPGSVFTGSLDGAGHALHGLTINRPDAMYQGLFGITGSGAGIQNLRIENANVHGGNRTGLLLGEARDTLAEAIVLAGEVVSTGQYAGGAAGYAQGVTFGGIFGHLHAEGGDSTGGLVGYLFQYSTLDRSHAMGKVRGNNKTGGLVGHAYGGNLVTDSFSRADVFGGDEVGGLVGHQELYQQSMIRRCYAAGMVNGTGTRVGGLLGRLSAGGLEASYYNSDLSNAPGGGGEARTTGEMTYPHGPATYLSWDFDSVWLADSSGTLNDGYPLLRWSSLGRFLLVYEAGAGGEISGPGRQWVDAHGDGEEVMAIPDPGAVFFRWSDGSAANPRQDFSLGGPLHLIAFFRSAGGVDIDWYVTHQIAPGPGQTWADLDGMDWTGKGMSLRDEFIAGTDPNDAGSRFRAWIEGGAIHFEPNLADRLYTLRRSVDLMNWAVVPGQSGIPGGSGPLIETSPAEDRLFHRVEATLP